MGHSRQGRTESRLKRLGTHIVCRNNVFSKENYQQDSVDGRFSFLACEVILVDKEKKPELGLPETQRHQASSELSLI